MYTVRHCIRVVYRFCVVVGDARRRATFRPGFFPAVESVGCRGFGWWVGNRVSEGGGRVLGCVGVVPSHLPGVIPGLWICSQRSGQMQLVWWVGAWRDRCFPLGVRPPACRYFCGGVGCRLFGGVVFCDVQWRTCAFAYASVMAHMRHGQGIFKQAGPPPLPGGLGG